MRSPIPPKARYVVSQGLAGNHTCHWPGCNRQVPPAMWGCKPHWFALPPGLRAEVFRNFRPGQEVTKTPSREYVEVARKVQDWIAEHVAAKAKGTLI
jgi:hypothetical protein